MWNRVHLKTYAKQMLDHNLFGTKWLMSALVVFLNTVLPSTVISTIYAPIYMTTYFATFLSMPSADMFASSFGYGGIASAGLMFVFMMILIIIANLLMLVLTFSAGVFVIAPLDIGIKRYFLALRDPYDRDAPSISLLFSCFKKGEYIKAVKSWGITYLFLQLWLLIPFAGIILYLVKSYEYFYVPYMIADNPELDRKSAMTISSQMTFGEKADIFVFQLSFLGWKLLSVLTFVGQYWEIPYEQAAYANLYDFAKKRAIGTGMYAPEVFGINPDGDPNDPFRTPLDLNMLYIRNRQYSRGFNL